MFIPCFTRSDLYASQFFYVIVNVCLWRDYLTHSLHFCRDNICRKKTIVYNNLSERSQVCGRKVVDMAESSANRNLKLQEYHVLVSHS